MIDYSQTVTLNVHYEETLTVSTTSYESDSAKDGMEDVISLAIFDGSTTFTIGTGIDGAEKAIKALQDAVTILKGGK